MRHKIAAMIVIGLLGGCQSAAQKPASQPANGSTLFAHPAPASVQSQGAPGSIEEQVLIKRIYLVRSGGFHTEKLILSITPSGRYSATGIPWQGSTMSKEGELENNQLRSIIAAFAGWDDLRPNYLPAAESSEDFRIDLKYGDKAVLASDAAELPPAFLRAYRELRTQIGF